MEFLGSGFLVLIVLLAIIFILVYRWVTKNPDALTSKYEARKTIKGNPIENEKSIMEALKNSDFKKVGLDQEEHLFYAQTKFSISSFSEYIEVSFRHDQLSTEINFKSKCALPTQVVAWGKNKRNYRKFEKELKKLIPTSAMTNAG